MPPPSRTSVLILRRTLFWPAFLPLIIVGSVLVNWAFVAQTVFAAPAASASAPGQNTVQQFWQQGQQRSAPQGASPALLASSTSLASQPRANTTSKHFPSAEPAKMKDQTYVLDNSFVLHRPTTKTSSATPKVRGAAIPAGSTPLIFKGSDGRLEIDLPRASLDLTHASLADGSAPVGQFFLQIHQMSGHSIQEASILGTYQIQIVDSQGHVVQGVVLTHPATMVYHYQPWEMQDLKIDPQHVHLSWPDVIAAQAAKQPKQALLNDAASQTSHGLVVPLTNQAQAQTLTAQSLVLTGTMTVSATPTIGTPAQPDLYEASGNDGQYRYTYPLTVAPGPAGFTPQLQLAYSSQSTNERSSRTSPAGDEGEGWALSLGSISVAQYPASSTGGAATWYSLNGVDGVSDKLIPIPNQSGSYETQHISHLLIRSTGSCWDVWGKDGSFEQLGCTADSLRTTSAGPYEWDTNAILAPYNDQSQVKMIRISYLQDSPSSGVIRDAGMKQIQYGIANLKNNWNWTQIIGTVDFHYHLPAVPSGQSAFATAYGNNYRCVSTPLTTTTLRCDDPLTDGVIPPPEVMSTMTLDSVTSYIGTDSSASNRASSYALTYSNDGIFWICHDPFTGVAEYCAGEHLLTGITPTAFVQGTPKTLPGVIFG